MINLRNVCFVSNSHQRYENGVPVCGLLQGFKRAIKIEDNINGGEGYTVTVFNLDGNHLVWGNNVQMAPKPMKVIQQSAEKIVLRGFGYDKMAFAMGAGEAASFAHYGLSIILKNEEIDKILLHMHDRNVDIEYFKEMDSQESFDYSGLPFYALQQPAFNRLSNNITMVKIWEEEVVEEKENNVVLLSLYIHRARKKTGKYHCCFHANVTEKLVGISEDDNVGYKIPWELLREEEHKGKKFMVLCGWGDPMSTGGQFLHQFNYYKIGIEKKIFADFLVQLMRNNPDYYSADKMRNVIWLEGFEFEDGQIFFK
jgi:hypothetical protein